MITHEDIHAAQIFAMFLADSYKAELAAHVGIINWPRWMVCKWGFYALGVADGPRVDMSKRSPFDRRGWLRYANLRRAADGRITGHNLPRVFGTEPVSETS